MKETYIFVMTSCRCWNTLILHSIFSLIDPHDLGELLPVMIKGRLAKFTVLPQCSKRFTYRTLL